MYISIYVLFRTRKRTIKKSKYVKKKIKNMYIEKMYQQILKIIKKKYFINKSNTNDVGI